MSSLPASTLVLRSWSSPFDPSSLHPITDLAGHHGHSSSSTPCLAHGSPVLGREPDPPPPPHFSSRATRACSTPPSSITSEHLREHRLSPFDHALHLPTASTPNARARRLRTKNPPLAPQTPRPHAALISARHESCHSGRRNPCDRAATAATPTRMTTLPPSPPPQDPRLHHFRTGLPPNPPPLRHGQHYRCSPPTVPIEPSTLATSNCLPPAISPHHHTIITSSRYLCRPARPGPRPPVRHTPTASSPSSIPTEQYPAPPLCGQNPHPFCSPPPTRTSAYPSQPAHHRSTPPPRLPTSSPRALTKPPTFELPPFSVTSRPTPASISPGAAHHPAASHPPSRTMR